MDEQAATGRGISPTAESNTTTTTQFRVGVRKWLNEKLRIELTDGRVLVGIFVCTDNEPNIALAECEEHWIRQEATQDGVDAEKTLPKRRLGMVIVARKHIKRILRLKGNEDNVRTDSSERKTC